MPTKWQNLSDAGITNSECYALATSRYNEGLLIAGLQGNGNLKYQNENWRAATAEDGMKPLIHPTNPNIFYISGSEGKMQKTIDGGKTLFDIDGDMLADGDKGAWVTPIAMDRENPNVLYSARSDVWKSIDAGNSWQKISNFDAVFKDITKANSIAISPSSPNTIYLTKQGEPTKDYPNRIYHSNNGGKTWEDIGKGLPLAFAMPTHIAIHPTLPDVAWVTFSGYEKLYKVFETKDGGVTWKNISGSLPNIPINTIVCDEDMTTNALYIGTDFGVFYRNIYWNDWIPFNDQLPTTVVTDLEIQYSERKIYAATYGRGIFKSELQDDISKNLSHTANKQMLVSSGLNIYPNPAHDYVTLEWIDNKNPLQSIEIKDTFGRVIYQKEDFFGIENIPIQQLSSGLYLVQIKTFDGLEVLKKLIIL